ncbi:hypothetical protein PRZ48_006845 [Zasmidium cellare]|uniref:Arginosuccinase n=1 Tax=Zasmidium cellare TaxID=395010 RepID=A0ABR0EHS9_ZASCE|nr:hypothetical protein PRZ48_006845 [Zasmidium cellare]
MPSKIENGGEPFFAGRLSKPMSELLRQNNEAPRLVWEQKNMSHILQVDLAHAVMLQEQGLITRQQACDLVKALQGISKGGQFVTKDGYGSMVLQIEGHVAKQIGEDTAGRLAIARSRLDQGATVWRLSAKAQMRDITEELARLQDTLLSVAARYSATPSINYTHLQQAQPATFGHYLLAFRDRLQDSFDALTQIYERVDRCPLGGVGLSGTDFDIDRHRTASLLGFAEVLDNSRLCRDSYYQVEIMSALAMMMIYLNDLCTDLHIYSSNEFNTIELDDSHTSTSSIFPQKKNPYALETIKAKAAEAMGWTTTAFAIFRNEGTGDTGARSVSQLDGARDTCIAMLRLTAEVIDGLSVNEERYESLLEGAWVTTNRLSNILLAEFGMSYRSAHGVVARLVKNCLTKGIPKTAVTVDMLQAAAREMDVDPISITQEGLTLALDHKAFIHNSRSFGGVGPDQVERMESLARAKNSANHQWVAGKELKSIEAIKELDAVCAKLQQSSS